MKTIDKLLFKIAERFALVETLATKATLIRLSNLRILVLSGYQGANSTLAVPSADKPSGGATGPTLRTDSTDRSTALGYVAVSSSNGYVQRYYAGSYNASGSGVSNVASTDKSYGIVAWIIGGGYGLTSILSRLSAIFRDWRWRHEESTETDEGYCNISQRGEGNKRGMHRLQTGELPNTQDRDGLTVACNIESNRLSIIGGDISCKGFQWFNICGLRNLREYERAGANRNDVWSSCTRSTIQLCEPEVRLILRGVGNISEGRCAA